MDHPARSEKPPPAKQNCFEGYCLGCQYALQRLTSHECRECGKVFDPNNPSTYSAKPTRWHKLLIGSEVALPIILTACSLIVLLWITMNRIRDGTIFSTIDTEIWIPAVPAFVCLIAYSFCHRDGGLASRSYDGVAGLVAALLIPVSFFIVAITPRFPYALLTVIFLFAVSAGVAVRTCQASAMRSKWTGRICLVLILIAVVYVAIHFRAMDLEHITSYWGHWFWTAQRW